MVAAHPAGYTALTSRSPCFQKCVFFSCCCSSCRVHGHQQAGGHGRLAGQDGCAGGLCAGKLSDLKKKHEGLLFTKLYVYVLASWQSACPQRNLRHGPCAFAGKPCGLVSSAATAAPPAAPLLLAPSCPPALHAGHDPRPTCAGCCTLLLLPCCRDSSLAYLNLPCRAAHRC